MGPMPEKFILSGIYLCGFSGYEPFLTAMTWILGTAWEVSALCLAVKHFRDLRRGLTGSVISDCLTVLIKSHLFYFAG
jgi:hypothetical protein